MRECGGGMGDFTFANNNSFTPEQFVFSQSSSQDLQGGMVFPHGYDNNPFFISHNQSHYSEFFDRMAPPPLYESPPADHHMRIPAMISGASTLGMHSEKRGDMTARELMDAKAQAASRSHSEAERRRRERINGHLTKLRTMLPSTSKTDKASLLAEVIQHVKNLKDHASVIGGTNVIPTENDELTVDASDQGGKLVIKASICCEDRSDLLQDVIRTLKCLRLKTLKVEISTVGGRIKTLVYVTGDDDYDGDRYVSVVGEQQRVTSIHEALKAVMEKKTAEESPSGNVKRQKTHTLVV